MSTRCPLWIATGGGHARVVQPPGGHQVGILSLLCVTARSSLTARWDAEVDAEFDEIDAFDAEIDGNYPMERDTIRVTNDDVEKEEL